ncbi:MAG: FMN-binding glutamate synthase family protein [Myxococcales bacterium]|nr:FMN-binding glutamate synthase family protein [Myxococcales bacterium]MCB9520777.1 FMN-binding glutamate synthase family protein [Myxococcales bacterium]MCB9532479.1 FMN-binding glutamate synthase family protein [Myxococcales bacterium]MCB9533494.1 FMN-binding glutamate synthase family protein [Myxococcales bacterium]
MFAIGVVIALAAVVIYDLTQRRHAILRNFPIIGHFRYMLEAIGPELRQYIVTSNDEERPFSRDQRSWVYASSKKQNNYFGFGTDNDLERAQNHLIVRHAASPVESPHDGEPGVDPLWPVACAKVLGGARGRRRAFRPESVFYVSAMSYGSLSSRAVEAINRGVAIAGGLHNTGEGGIAPPHAHGGPLIWQLGTGYFGARTPDGSFSMDRMLERVAAHDVRAIEIKLSQGAKPGRGGVLPAAKVTPEIAAIRGIPVGHDCISPAGHSAFDGPDRLLDFAESIADATGLPVGIKSAVGELRFWERLADLMAASDRGVDFITIDGGEGGTGAAPLVFADHVALPFKVGFAQVYRVFAERGLADRVVFAGSGRLGFPVEALFAMALGADLVGVAREAMLSIGCIQAQRCHTGHCPTGVATQNAWLMRGLDPTEKSARLANYLVSLRKELTWLANATGKRHPAEVTLDDFALIDGQFRVVDLRERFGYQSTRLVGAAA